MLIDDLSEDSSSTPIPLWRDKIILANHYDKDGGRTIARSTTSGSQTKKFLACMQHCQESMPWRMQD